MADPYIDPQETLAYGPFAREQMANVCKGLITACDDAVDYCIAQQKAADVAMKKTLDAHPARPPAIADELVVAESRDLLVRFGSYLGSLKGRPVDAAFFFGRESPSIFSRRRLVKLVSALGEFRDKIEIHKAKLRDAKAWAAEFEDVHSRLQAFEKRHRAARVDVADLGPEVAAARESWLSVYSANKGIIGGILRHCGKVQLLPLVFDDLAEVHRVSGVTDEGVAPEPVSPAAGGSE